MRNAARHGAHRLHLVGFAQLRLQLVAVGFGLFAARQVAGKHRGGFALGMAFKRHAYLHRQLFGTGGAGGHLAQHGLGGELRQFHGLPRSGQKTLQRAAQCVLRTALEQGRSRGVEDGNQPVLVYANDGVQRRVDHSLQPLFAGVELFIALLHRQGALLQRVALGQQRALVNHGAQKLQLHGTVILRRFDARNVQVARDVRLRADGEDHLGHLAVPLGLCLLKCGAHPWRIGLRDKGHQRGERAITLGGLKRPVRHRVGLHHHVVLVQHH